MRGGGSEPLTCGHGIPEPAQRFGARLIRGHTKPLELLGARGEMRRDFVVQLTVELIGANGRVPE